MLEIHLDLFFFRNTFSFGDLTYLCSFKNHLFADNSQIYVTISLSKPPQLYIQLPIGYRLAVLHASQHTKIKLRIFPRAW